MFSEFFMACSLKNFQLGVAPSQIQAQTFNPILSSTPIASQTQGNIWSLLKPFKAKITNWEIEMRKYALAMKAKMWVARSLSFPEIFLSNSNSSSLMSPISENPINFPVAWLNTNPHFIFISSSNREQFLLLSFIFVYLISATNVSIMSGLNPVMIPVKLVYFDNVDKCGSFKNPRFSRMPLL